MESSFVQRHMGRKPQLTGHAKDRLFERLKVRRETAEKMATRALLLGFDASLTKGQFRKYLDKLYLSGDKVCNNIRVYGEHAFLFHDSILITVFVLPHEFRAAAGKIRRRMTAGTAEKSA